MKSGLRFGCLVAISAMFGSVGADARSDFRSAMVLKQAEYAKAMSQKNLIWFEKNLSSEFSYVAFGGKSQGRSATISGVNNTFAEFSKITVKSEIIGVDFQGATSTVRVKQIFHGTTKAGNNYVRGFSITLDTWRKENGKWLLYKVAEAEKPVYKMNEKDFTP